MSISKTAFLVNQSRALKEELSKDCYAKLWVDDEVKKLWNDFARECYSYDDLELALRNRWFLDRAENLLSKNNNSIFINIGAGFTNYPFLFRTEHPTYEIDFQEIVEYKQKKLSKFIQKKYVPNRTINFLSADLNSINDQKTIEEVLQKWFQKKTSFIAMEGVTYYLQKERLDNLFKILSRIQVPESQLGIVYWSSDITKSPVFQRLEDFFEKEFQFPKKSYTFLEKEYFTTLDAYKLIEYTNMTVLEKKYTKGHLLENPLTMLQEHIVLLERK